MNTDLLIYFAGLTGSFVLCLISYRMGNRHGTNAANQFSHQQGYKRGYDTAWVDRQLHDAKQREAFRCKATGQFTSKPKIG